MLLQCIPLGSLRPPKCYLQVKVTPVGVHLHVHLGEALGWLWEAKLHTERPFLIMLVAASILTARNNHIDARTPHCFIKASRFCKVAACTASLQHSATAPFFAKVASSNKMHEALKLGAAVMYTARAPATTKVLSRTPSLVTNSGQPSS